MMARKRRLTIKKSSGICQMKWVVNLPLASDIQFPSLLQMKSAKQEEMAKMAIDDPSAQRAKSIPMLDWMGPTVAISMVKCRSFQLDVHIRMSRQWAKANIGPIKEATGRKKKKEEKREKKKKRNIVGGSMRNANYKFGICNFSNAE
jgi:hypothetical protein